MSIWTTGAGIVQTKIANSSKRRASLAILKWTRQPAWREKVVVVVKRVEKLG